MEKPFQCFERAPLQPVRECIPHKGSLFRGSPGSPPQQENPRSHNLLGTRVAFLASPSPTAFLDHDASFTSCALPRKISEDRINFLLHKAHSRQTAQMVTAAPWAHHVMSFLDLLSSHRFNRLLCNFGHQSPLLDVQSNCQNST